MSLAVDILVFILLALLGLEFFRRLVRRFVRRAKEIHLDVAYLIFVAIGAFLYFPKATDEEALRRSLTTTERNLSTTKKELDATRKESLQTKQLLDGTREDLKTEKENQTKQQTYRGVLYETVSSHFGMASNARLR